MNKAELISEIADMTGNPKTEIGDTVTALLHAITHTLSKGERVTLVGFGTFERRNRAARVGHNPQTMKTLRIPASRVPAFRAGSELKDIVDGRQRLGGWEGSTPSRSSSSAPKKSAAKKTTKRR